MIPGESGVPLVIRGLIKMSPKPGNTRLYWSSAGVGRYLANGTYCLLDYFQITSFFSTCVNVTRRAGSFKSV